VFVNVPPSGGAFSLSPGSGTAFETSFTLSCDGWVDLEEPLQYAFRYYRDEEGPDSQIVLSSRSSSKSTSVILPNGNLTLVAYVYDALGGYSSSEASVTVILPVITDPIDYVNNLTDLIIDNNNLGDTASVLLLIEAASTLLNNQNVTCKEAQFLVDKLLELLGGLTDGDTYVTDEQAAGILSSLAALSSGCVDEDSIKEITGILGDTLTSSSNENEAGAVLSNLLESSGCANLDDIQALFAQVLTNANAEAVEGEEATQITTDVITSTSTTASGDGGASTGSFSCGGRIDYLYLYV
jgi:hypothetical protein